ncbi:MAG: hypothetical protein HKN68_02355 [Saprospiraceae bacterium]|nr:hypothetical protein [Saprospiraceae bacterium]
MNHLIKLSITSILLFIYVLSFAQAPQAFNYQGVAQDVEGNPIQETEISLLISIVRGFEDGNIIFGEVHQVMTSKSGLFSLRIGQGEPYIGNIRNVEWGNDQYYIRVEIDPEGGEDFIDLGTTQLYSVPYALYAAEAGNASGGSNQNLELNGTNLSIENGNSVDLSSLQDGTIDADADPSNELQDLSISGTDLSISNGNTISLGSLEDADADPNNEFQNLSLNGTDLSISNGNTISISGLQDGTIDADADPTNELQQLSLNGNTLNISDGNSVDLSGVGNGGGSGDSDLWEEESDEGLRTDFINVRFNEGEMPSSVRIDRVDENIGLIRAYNREATEMKELASANQDGEFGNYGFSGDSDLLYWIGVSETLPLFELRSPDHTLASIYASPTSGGFLNLRGPNGMDNVRLTSRASNNNRGSIGVYDENGNDQAGLYVDAQGNGIVYGTMKNFKIPHPKDPSKEIVYASMEGPEAGVYLRGTAVLKEGEANIDFPEYFSLIISDQRITVMTTPLSASSKGLAVVEKNLNGFKIKELYEGKGTYEIDWEVKANRKEFDDFKVVRDRNDSREQRLSLISDTIRSPKPRKND